MLLPAILLTLQTSTATTPPPAMVSAETLITGLASGTPNPDSPAEVFSTVFAALPPEVTVHPSENYWYWQLAADGRTLRGNIRLAAGRREKGELCFAYSECLASPCPELTPLSLVKWFGPADGISIISPSPLSCRVTWKSKTVHFRFLALDQSPPRNLPLRTGETFVQRTCDESGLRFILICDRPRRAFAWILDPSLPHPEHFSQLSPNLAIGRRTGFIFWLDPIAGNRKVLAAVAAASVRDNDWNDGPFDQLADNYADQTDIRSFIESVMPSTKGQIDRFGNFKDRTEAARVAIVPYGTYRSPGDVRPWLNKFRGREMDAMHTAQGTAISDHD
jgi:hypothetical protein